LQTFALRGFRSKVSVSQFVSGPLPIWVKNGSRGLAARCPLRPQQRTSSLRPAHCIRMSDIEAVLFVVIVALMVALAMLVAG
jgi:hypothetical protein